MREIINLTKDADQEHIIQFEESEITLRLYFNNVAQFWAFDVTFKGKSRIGVKLVTGVRHLKSAHYPFDFAVKDTTALDVDPFLINDFSTERVKLFLLEREDVKSLRGFDVEL